jgi:hypothetical protein
MAVLKNKPASQVDMRKVKELLGRGRRGAGNQPGAPKARQVTPPGMVPPGGAPGAPGGSTAGGGGVPPGVRGAITPPSGGPDAMGPGARTQEVEIGYVEIDAKDIEKAVPAQALMPVRLVVVTGFLPYKKQLEEYARALKVYSFYNLDGNDLPYYNGLVVERQKLMLDGKEVVDDWQQLDIKETFGDIYARCLEWEPNNMMSLEQYNEAPQELKDLYPFFPRLVPDWYHRLVLPRPKLMSGKYAAITMPSEIEALKELKKNNTAPPLKSQRQKKFDKEVDPFGDPSLGMQQGMGGPGGDRGDTGTAGGGRSESGPPGFRPGMPPGRPGMPGIPGGPDNEMRTGGPGQPGMPGTNQAMPEDAWMFRFIDASTEPGYAYRYRVKFKVHNPNLGRNPMELAISELAKQEELESPWFVINDVARSPQDEYLYAAANEPKANPPRVTEKVPPPTGAQADETWLQVHKWFRDVRPKGQTRADPLGDWIIADIKAVRGQYLADSPKIELPIWIMTHSKFLFRDTPAPPQRNVRRTAKDKRSWEIEINPRLDGKEVLVVDFEGGSGDHIAAKNRRVQDTASMDVLLMTEDGKLRLVRSTVDLADKSRQDRVQAWTDWLQKVEQDTQQSQNSGQNPFGPGGGESGGGGARGDR